MKTYLKNDLEQTYLIIEGKEKEKEDYQSIMITDAQVPGLLRTEVRYVDETCRYYYDISGMKSFAACYEKGNLKREDIKRFLKNLDEELKILHKYMLDGGCLLLKPEYIFCHKEKFFFCYYPPGVEAPKEEFHALTDYFVKEMNSEDSEGEYLANMLHKMTMEENYSVGRIVEELLEEDSEGPMVRYVDMMGNEGDGESLVEEGDLWRPLRRLFGRW